MPFNVPLSRALRKAGWRAKVFDEEGPETPHVTIQFKTEKVGRVSLRNGTFVVPPAGRWNDMPDEMRTAIEKHWKELQEYSHFSPTKTLAIQKCLQVK
jgi:hypothetical protein